MFHRKPKRLDDLPTLWIDRNRRLRFRFGLGRYRAYAGDTVATALYRNGFIAFSRSPRFGRPRGLRALDGETARTRIEVNGMPGAVAETTFVRDGMKVSSRHDRFASRIAGGDRAGIGTWLRRILSAREKTGRSPARGGIDPGFRLSPPPEVRFLHGEVCVIGGGPAGMSAALAAAERGVRVILLERRTRPGGHYAGRETEWAPGVPMFRRAEALAREMETHGDLRIFAGTTATALSPDGPRGWRVDAVRAGGPDDRFFFERLEIRARSLVVATGCRDRYAVFENNDRPGAMTADAAFRLARLYGIMPGQRAVLAASDDAGLSVALELHRLGLAFSAVADRRPDWAGSESHRALADSGIPVLGGWAPAGVIGRKRVRGAILVPVSGTGERRFPCDLLIASAGRTPALELPTAAGASLRWDEAADDWRLGDLPQRMHPAGNLLGIAEPSALEASGRRAGLEAVADTGLAADPERESEWARYRSATETARRFGSAGDFAAGWPANASRRAFAGIDDDISLRDVEDAVRSGFDRPGTAMGFFGLETGPEPAGGGAALVRGLDLARALARFRKVSPSEIPPDLPEPPAIPIPAGIPAAGLRDPIRRTPMAERMRAAGALPARIGDWALPGRYAADPPASEELAAVRAGVGLMDASALGKFRVFGPGALAALHRVCVNQLAGLRPGEAVASVLCRPDGRPVDIGEVALHDRDDYFLVVRPERADRTEAWIRRFAPPDAPPFHVVDLTDALGSLILAGAAAGEVLQRITRRNVSSAALPVLGYRRFRIGESVPIRLIRTDAWAEPSFVLHVPASRVEAVWDLLVEAGADLGIRPFGAVAETTLRLRRGGIDLVRESEPGTTLVDLRLGKFWGLERTGPRPVGEDAWRRVLDREDRTKRVFFRRIDDDAPLPDGAVVLENGRPAGRVCLSRFHPDIGVAMGTALVPAHLAEPGLRLAVAVSGDEEDEEDFATIQVREWDGLGKAMG